MAMTYLEKLKQQQTQQTPQGNSGLSGVSQNTQENLQKYQQGYQPNQQTQQAQQNMQNVQNQRPQSYQSKYGAALDNILQQIQNPGQFKYEFNSDNLFKSYADLMTQNAKQASQNAMGQAAGLTGGYGNTYAMAAGNQAYQEAIRPLYDRGMQLAALARENYDKDRADLYNQMGALQNMDEADYGRYRDTMADWRQDEANATEAYRDERNFGYQDYANMLDYWQNTAAAENADSRAGQEMDLRNAQFNWQVDTDARDYEEAVRQANLDEDFRQAQLAEQIRGTNLDEQYRRDSLAQNAQQFAQTSAMDWAQLAEKQREFDASMSEDQRQTNQKMAAAWVTDILANGQIPSNELLVAAGLSYEDAQKLIAQVQAAGGPGPKTKKPTADELVQGVTAGTLAAINMPATGMPLMSDYEGLAKAAADELAKYDKGTEEYEAANYYSDLYKNMSKNKDSLLAMGATPSATTVQLPADAQAEQKARQEIQAASGQTGVKMVWDSKKKKFVPAT